MLHPFCMPARRDLRTFRHAETGGGAASVDAATLEHPFLQLVRAGGTLVHFRRGSKRCTATREFTADCFGQAAYDARLAHQTRKVASENVARAAEGKPAKDMPVRPTHGWNVQSDLQVTAAERVNLNANAALLIVPGMFVFDIDPKKQEGLPPEQLDAAKATFSSHAANTYLHIAGVLQSAGFLQGVHYWTFRSRSGSYQIVLRVDADELCQWPTVAVLKDDLDNRLDLFAGRAGQSPWGAPTVASRYVLAPGSYAQPHPAAPGDGHAQICGELTHFDALPVVPGSVLSSVISSLQDMGMDYAEVASAKVDDRDDEPLENDAPDYIKGRESRVSVDLSAEVPVSLEELKRCIDGAAVEEPALIHGGCGWEKFGAEIIFPLAEGVVSGRVSKDDAVAALEYLSSLSTGVYDTAKDVTELENTIAKGKQRGGRTMASLMRFEKHAPKPSVQPTPPAAPVSSPQIVTPVAGSAGAQIMGAVTTVNLVNYNRCRGTRSYDIEVDPGVVAQFSHNSGISPALAAQAWPGGMGAGKNAVPRDNVPNAQAALLRLCALPAHDQGRIDVQYDTLSGSPMVRFRVAGTDAAGNPAWVPGEWARASDGATLQTLSNLVSRHNTSVSWSPQATTLRAAAANIAMSQAMCAPLVRMTEVPWDGVDRFDVNRPAGDHVLSAMRAEHSPEDAEAVRIHMRAHVMRLLSRGTKYDQMIILQGVQGLRKSTMLDVLAFESDWFGADLEVGMSDKEVVEITEGKFIIEVEELDGMIRRSAEDAKKLVSRRTIKVRASYAYAAEETRLQYALWGTTNDDRYLPDPRDNRRFWILRVGGHDAAGVATADDIKNVFDIDWFRANRQQLWAQVVHEVVQVHKRDSSALAPSDALVARMARKAQEAVLAPNSVADAVLLGLPHTLGALEEMHRRGDIIPIDAGSSKDTRASADEPYTGRWGIPVTTLGSLCEAGLGRSLNTQDQVALSSCWGKMSKAVEVRVVDASLNAKFREVVLGGKKRTVRVVPHKWGSFTMPTGYLKVDHPHGGGQHTVRVITGPDGVTPALQAVPGAVQAP